MTVTVLASTTSKELLKFQLDNNVCLMSNVTLESVHIAGLTAVGCHVSDSIGIRFFTHYSRESEDTYAQFNW